MKLILLFFLSLTISHTKRVHARANKFITSSTSNEIYPLEYIGTPSRIKFCSNLLWKNLSIIFLARSVLQNGGAFLLEFSPCLEFRLKTDASLSRKSQLHARNRNDSRSRDEIVSSLFRSGGRFTWIILVPLVNEYPSPRNKGQQLASSVPLENDILLCSCYTELLVVRESGQ